MPFGQRTGSQLLHTSVLRMEDRPDGSAPVRMLGMGAGSAECLHHNKCGDPVLVRSQASMYFGQPATH